MPDNYINASFKSARIFPRQHCSDPQLVDLSSANCLRIDAALRLVLHIPAADFPHSGLNEPVMIQVSKPEFSIGRLLATRAAIKALEKTDVRALDLVARHVNKDWGNLSEDDKRLNDEALHDGSRILSAYILTKTSVKIWIITEAADDDGERAATTVLLPEEY